MLAVQIYKNAQEEVPPKVYRRVKFEFSSRSYKEGENDREDRALLRVF